MYQHVAVNIPIFPIEFQLNTLTFIQKKVETIDKFKNCLHFKTDDHKAEGNYRCRGSQINIVGVLFKRVGYIQQEHHVKIYHGAKNKYDR